MSYRTVTDPTQRLRPVVNEYSSTQVEHADEAEREELAQFGIELPKDHDRQLRDDCGETRS